MTTTLPDNPYLTEHAEPDERSPWAPPEETRRVVPVDHYRVQAMTKHHLEDLCRIVYKYVGVEATKYKGSRVTDELATIMATDVGEALEALRLALITHAIAEKKPTDHLRAMDLTAVKEYFEKHIGARR